MKKNIFLLIFLSGIATYSCYVKFPENQNITKIAPTATPNQEATPIPEGKDEMLEFRKILNGEKSSVNDYQVRVIGEESEFQRLWEDHTGSETNPFFLPKVDFNSKKVLAIFLGDRPTTGYKAEIDKIIENKNEIRVIFRETKPKSGDLVKSEITQPFLIVEIKNTDKPIFFENPVLNRNSFLRIPFSPIVSGEDSGIKTFTNRVSKNEIEFNNLYQEHLANRNSSSVNAFPKIDFNKNIVASIFLGKRTNFLSKVEINEVIKTENQIIVRAKENIIFNRNNFSSSPFTIFSIPRSDLPVKFDIDFIFSPENDNNFPEISNNLEIRTLTSGEKSNILIPEYLIIQNQSEFLQMWRKHDFSTEIPEVDFGNNTMIAVFLGSQEKNTGVKISRAIETNNDVKIFVEITKDPNNLIGKKNQPFVIGLIPKVFKQGNFIINNLNN